MKRLLFFILLIFASLTLFAQQRAYYCAFDGATLPSNWVQSDVWAATGNPDWGIGDGFAYSLCPVGDTVNTFLASPTFTLVDTDANGRFSFYVATVTLDEGGVASLSNFQLFILVDNDTFIFGGEYYVSSDDENGKYISVDFSSLIAFDGEAHSYNFIIQHTYQESADGAFCIYNFALKRDNSYYLVVPDPGQGTGVMDYFVTEDGGLFTVPENAFTPPSGKEFLFWEGIDLDLTNSESQDFWEEGEDVEISSDIYLVPVFGSKFAVNFRSNLGFGTMQPDEGSQYLNYIVPECEYYCLNHAFVCWNTQADGEGDSYYPGDEIENTDLEGNLIKTSITLYAQWEEVDGPLTLSFDANGGDGEMDDVEVLLGVVYTIPQCPFEYEGYAFVGWNTDGSGEGRAYSPGQHVTFNTGDGVLTLYAQWQAKTHILFDGNGGDGEMDEVCVMPGESYTIPECPFENECHVFANWNTDASGDGDTYTPGQRVVLQLPEGEEEITLYAQWYSKVQVYFDGNGGDGDMEDTCVMPGESYTIPECLFENEGFLFAGWDTDFLGDGDAYTPGQQVTLQLEEGEEELTLYAQWMQLIQISFDANDGDGTMDDIYVAPGDTFTVPECPFEYEWHTFLGWNTDASGDGDAYVPGQTIVFPVDGDETSIELYAQWEEIFTTTIIFDGNEADSGTMPDTVIESGVDFQLPANLFEREGFIFLCWNSEPDGSGTIFVDRSTVNFNDEEVILYAQWQELPKIYTLNFNANGGRGVMEPVILNEGESTIVPDCGFSCQGYHFVGWNTKADGTGTSYTIGATVTLTDGDLILYAQWEKDVPVVAHVVLFDANGGEGTMSPMNVWSNQYYEMPECAFTREGYTFVGWCEVADGSETIYLPGIKLRFSADTRYYAIWWSDNPESIDNLASVDVKVYPNPVVSTLHIEGVTPTLVEVLTLTGRVVRTIEQNATAIDMGSLPNGVYMLRITAPEGTVLRKVIKR